MFEEMGSLTIFFMSALWFNCNNWLFKISEMDAIILSADPVNRLNKILIILFQVPLVVFFMVVMNVNWDAIADYDNGRQYLRLVICPMYIAISLMYAYICYCFNKRVRKLTSISKSTRLRTLITTIMLSVLFMLRGVFTLIRGIITYDEGFERRAWNKGDRWYPVYISAYIFSVEILPVIILSISIKFFIYDFLRRTMKVDQTELLSDKEYSSGVSFKSDRSEGSYSSNGNNDSLIDNNN